MAREAQKEAYSKPSLRRRIKEIDFFTRKKCEESHLAIEFFQKLL